VQIQNDQGLSPHHFPVSVIMKRQQIQHGRWSVPRWELLGVVAGEHLATEDLRKTVIHSSADGEQTLWTGFVLELYKDSAESYWYNLVGKTPSLFVICRPDEDGEMVPFTVSADYDEAGAYMEADDAVFSAQMPAEVYQWLEQYVVTNYVPREPRKRKRQKWTETEDVRHGPRPQPTKQRY